MPNVQIQLWDVGYLYRGEQYDPDLSMYYLRARYYNPVTGRLLSSDPLAGEGQRRYEYANADPVDGMDPSGRESYDSVDVETIWNTVQDGLPPLKAAVEKALASSELSS